MGADKPLRFPVIASRSTQPSPRVRPEATPGSKRGVSSTPGAGSTGTPTPAKSLLKRKSSVAATPQAARRRKL
jgi:hypothetical protein